MSKNCTLTEKL